MNAGWAGFAARTAPVLSVRMKILAPANCSSGTTPSRSSATGAAGGAARRAPAERGRQFPRGDLRLERGDPVVLGDVSVLC